MTTRTAALRFTDLSAWRQKAKELYPSAVEGAGGPTIHTYLVPHGNGYLTVAMFNGTHGGWVRAPHGTPGGGMRSIRATRYHDTETGCALGYRQDLPTLWRIYVRDAECQWAAVGPHYRTKSELLADLDRYARSWGF